MVRLIKWKFERYICLILFFFFCQDLTFLLGEDPRASASLKYPFAYLILSRYVMSSFSGLLKISAEALVLQEKIK